MKVLWTATWKRIITHVLLLGLVQGVECESGAPATVSQPRPEAVSYMDKTVSSRGASSDKRGQGRELHLYVSERSSYQTGQNIFSVMGQLTADVGYIIPYISKSACLCDSARRM